MTFRMRPVHEYIRPRMEFGRPTHFKVKPPKLLFDWTPDPVLKSKYDIKDPLCSSSQCGPIFSASEAMTERVNYKDRRDIHEEGGWPKEINLNDEEMVLRFKKKLERDDTLVRVLPELYAEMEHYLQQNNALEMYNDYYSEPSWEFPEPQEPMKAQLLNTFKDLWDVKRPAVWICFDADGDKMAVAHADLLFQTGIQDNYSYIWDFESSSKPLLSVDAGVPCCVLEYNPRNLSYLVAGLTNGQMAFFDTRRGSFPVSVSPPSTSFRDPVSSAVWINAKSGMEYFAASTDGQILWLDARNLNEHIDSLVLDFSKGEEPDLYKTVGITCLEYEPSIPTRYMVGTENGTVLGGNRKGKTLQEKITPPFYAHSDCVRTVQRNPSFLKNFLTVGDWRAKIFSEDAKESSIIWTGYHRARVTCGAWSPTKYGNFFTTREDGVIDAWDIVEDQNNPVLEFKTGSSPLKTIRIQEHGRYVAVGSDEGNVYLVEFSETFVAPSKNEKPLMTSIFERESRREKLIEGANRELRLKAAAKGGVEKKQELFSDLIRANNERLKNEFVNNLQTLERGGKIKVEKVADD